MILAVASATSAAAAAPSRAGPVADQTPPANIPAPARRTWALSGTAILPPGGGLQLTAAGQGYAAAAGFYATPIANFASLTATFDLTMAHGGGLAGDGISFAMIDGGRKKTTLPTAGGLGGGLGVQGLTGRAIAFTENNRPPQCYPSDHFVGVVDPAGKPTCVADYLKTVVPAAPFAEKTNHVLITVLPGRHPVYRVSLNGALVLDYTDPTPLPSAMYVGFTGGSGINTQLQLVAGVVIATTPIETVPAESLLTRTLRAPNEVSFAVRDVLPSAGIALALLLLVGFPAQIFNSTMQSHYSEVMGWFAFLRWPGLRAFGRPLRRLHDRLTSTVSWLHRTAAADGRLQPSKPEIAAVVLLAGLCGGLLDPHLALDAVSIQTLVGITASTALLTCLYVYVPDRVTHRLHRLRGHVRIYGGGIAIGVACLLVSRLAGAEPGYLYGVWLGYALGPAARLPNQRLEGRVLAYTSALILAAVLAVWLLWTPVKVATIATHSFPLEVLSTAMAEVFVGGMTTVVFGLFPMRFLDGAKVLGWRRAAWFLIFLVGLFLYVHVVLNNLPGTLNKGRNFDLTVALFILFGAASVLFWAYFRFRKPPSPLARAAPEQPAELKVG